MNFDMDYERLYYDKAIDLPNNDKISIITLVNKEKTRMLNVVCERNVANEIRNRRQNLDYTSTHFPEVTTFILKKLVENFDFYLEIANIRNGVYVNFLTSEANKVTKPIRISDGILFCIVANCPIVIPKQLMAMQSVEYDDRNDSVRIPINIISTDMLESTLKRAIEQEDYEMASRIKKELEYRKSQEEEPQV